MPGIIAFGRRWEVGSDDFVFPGCAEILIRLVWLLTVVIIWSYHAPYMDCAGGRLLQIYLSGVAVHLIVSVLLTTGLVRHSMRGTMMDIHSRRLVPKLIYIKIALGLPEFAWTVLGSIWAFTPENQCPAGTDFTIFIIRGLVVFNWILILLFLIGIAIVFDPLGHKHQIIKGVNPANAAMHEAQNAIEHSVQQRARIWEWRCKLLCCSCCPGCCNKSSSSGDEINVNDAFKDVASVFTGLFHDLDLVPSDLAAGLILLNIRHKMRRDIQRTRGFAPHRPPVTEPPQSSQNVLTSSPKLEMRSGEATRAVDFSPSALSLPFSAECSPGVMVETIRQLQDIAEESHSTQSPALVYDWMNPSTAYLYMKYALGSYGWMWHLYGGFWEGLYNLKDELLFCACCRETPPYITDDNCCHCNLAALKRVTELTDSSIVHVSFHNRVFEVPFYVAADHQTSCIVVAIRGTLSLHDALTDLAATTEAIIFDNAPQGWTAHKGILQAALFVKRQLEQWNILERAMELYPDYKLVITGHSLGAGAAVLLSLLLKNRYPEVRCFAYSPPGGLLNEAAARYSESFCMSVIVGDDLVPRLSLATLDLLKRQLVAEIESCRHPKYRVLLRGCWYAIFGSPAYQSSNNRLSHPLLSDTPVPNSYSYESLSEVARHASPVTAGAVAESRGQLYLPGRILQVEEREPMDSSVDMGPAYEARWMHREDYNQILVTPRMLSDHIPDTVVRVLRGLAAQYESTFSGVSVEPQLI